jgi:hypothetical protein
MVMTFDMSEASSKIAELSLWSVVITQKQPQLMIAQRSKASDRDSFSESRPLQPEAGVFHSQKSSACSRKVSFPQM